MFHRTDEGAVPQQVAALLSSLKFLTTKILVQCYLVLLIFHRTDESGLQQQVSTSIILKAFVELNDEGSDTAACHS